jgi:hypothetical protein
VLNPVRRYWDLALHKTIVLDACQHKDSKSKVERLRFTSGPLRSTEKQANHLFGLCRNQGLCTASIGNGHRQRTL